MDRYSEGKVEGVSARSSALVLVLYQLVVRAVFSLFWRGVIYVPVRVVCLGSPSLRRTLLLGQACALINHSHVLSIRRKTKLWS